MHQYTSVLVKRIMDGSSKPKAWGRADAERFAGLCFEKAPTCKCGCGDKTFPFTGKGGLTLKQILIKYIDNGEMPDFSDYLAYHYRLKVSASVELTNAQHQVIIASAIGDGCILYPYKNAKNPRLVWNMGNKEHAKFKQAFFDFIGCKYQEKKNPGFGDDWYCLQTSCHPIFKKYHDMVYPNGKKTITKNLLSELGDIGWAWIYGDDGHYCQSTNVCFLHTEGYGEEATLLFAESINGFIGFNGCVVHSYLGGNPKKQRFCVRFNRKGSDEFISRIKNYVATGVEYKIGKSDLLSGN